MKTVTIEDVIAGQIPEGYHTPTRIDMAQFDTAMTTTALGFASSANSKRHSQVSGGQGTEVLLHRTGSGGTMLSRHGRVFAIANKLTDNRLVVKFNTVGIPVWAENALRVMASAKGFEVKVTRDPYDVLTPWEWEVERSMEWYTQMGGDDHFKNHWVWKDVQVSTLDSLCSGNCKLGTASFIHRFLDNRHSVSIDEFLATPEDGIWRTDRRRAVAWATYVANIEGGF